MTVLASQPSVSMETDTTQRIFPPSRPSLPTVFITSRSSSCTLMSSGGLLVACALAPFPAESLNLIQMRLGESHR